VGGQLVTMLVLPNHGEQSAAKWLGVDEIIKGRLRLMQGDKRQFVTT
jgi:hypothetical protein